MTARKKQKEETYQKILHAAYQIFSEEGYEKASVNDICRIAGVTKGAVYFHFQSKEDILFTLIDLYLEKEKELFFTLNRYDENLEDSIRRMVEGIISFYLQNMHNSRFFLEFFALASRNDVVKQKCEKMYHDWHQIIEGFLHDGIARGVIAADLKVSEATTLQISLMQGMFMQLRLNNLEGKTEALIDEMIRLFSMYVKPADNKTAPCEK